MDCEPCRAGRGARPGRRGTRKPRPFAAPTVRIPRLRHFGWTGAHLRTIWRGNTRCIPVTTAMLLASLSFRAQPHKRAEALSAVDSLVQRMRGSTGCARSRILIDTEDANTFLIASEWSDPDAAEAFFTSREFQIFRGVRIL